MSIVSDRKKRTEANEWAIAAEEARREIVKAKARIATLESSIKIFIKKEKSGEPWPDFQGEKSR